MPAKRNRIARMLIQKMRHIIFEYSAKTGEQIAGVFIDKPNAQSRNYKIYGTAPLVKVMDELRCSMDNIYVEWIKEEKKHLLYPANPKLPQLTIDGNVTKLEYFTQSQLRKFIPHLIKYSTGRHYTGWNNVSLKPKWWPKDVPWVNVRHDVRSTEQKAKESWTSTMQRVIKDCYKYYGHEEMLHGQELEVQSSTLPQIGQEEDISQASTSANPDFEEMEVTSPVLAENESAFDEFQIMNESQLQKNVMYLLQKVGPSTTLLQPVHVVPVQKTNLEDTDSVFGTNDLK